MPEDTISVCRPGKWGNPFKVGDLMPDGTAMTQHGVVQAFAHALKFGRLLITPTEIRAELRGKNLACWCREGTPCHGNILLEAANANPAAI